jgi:hypothetical protein
MLQLLLRALREDENSAPRLPEFIPSEEIVPPCDLPRSSQPVVVVAYSAEHRLPDPLADIGPE